MTLWIKNPLGIFAEGAGGGIVVDGTRIVELVAAGAAPSTPVDEVFYASEHVVLPGLINTHHHFYQTLTRAFRPAADKALFDWLKALYPVWGRMEPEAFRLASRLAMVELLMSGCTTASDHHYVFPAGLEEAIDIQMEEAEKLGLRVALCRGSMDLSVENGGLPPKQVTQDIDTILADSERLVGRWHQREDGAMRQVVLAPCSPFSVSGDLMRESAKLGEALDVRLHTHLAETYDENDYCVQKFGVRPLDYVESLGWVSDRVWFAHGIHFTDNEMRRLGEAGTGVAHCPTSNMIIGSGVCSPMALEALGAPVGLACDGAAAADSSNLVQEVRQAFLLQRAMRGVGAVTHKDPLRWATKGSARCLGRKDIGIIAPGAQADFAMFRLDELRFSGYDDPVAAIVICGAHAADRIMVAGKWRIVDGEVPGLDLAELRHAHQDAARRVQAA
ncbi:8-oxoguanine deaminase [Parvibaculum sedimenti]|uniref:8-oxoguanine deaminase n=1 Tax=Parvibaculum sedimenti TaxID=2608632 RepID=A0A6N6VKI3_9HYPH|nr:8-oxoguanine deaminase [Parvibaculum sedimenti]KAB7741733.1 8-oxoguanine deaminase [Parvibaculum sedimenti]